MGRTVRALVRVELRELGPVWVGAVALVLVSSGEAWPFLPALGASTYAVAVVVLGAMAFGFEFRHRTLDGGLALPVPRAVVLLVKATVLVTLVASLSALAWTVTPLPTIRLGGWLFLAPVACGLSLAPWFTTIARSELAGVAFAGGLPAMLWLAARLAAGATNGFTVAAAADADRLALALFAPAFGAALLLGAVGAVVSFLRLQAVGGGSMRASDAPRLWSARAAPVGRRSRRPSPVVALIGKELRLQRLTFIVAALFALLWVAVVVSPAAPAEASNRADLQFAIAILYFGALVLLAGSLASAEERHLGTLQAQVLMPMSMRRQWTIKLGCVLGVLVVLLVGVPVVLHASGLGVELVGHGLQAGRLPVAGLAVAVVFGVSISIYVSSLADGGLRALVAAVASAVGLTAVFGAASFTVSKWTWALSVALTRAEWMPVWNLGDGWRWRVYMAAQFDWLPTLIGLALACFALRLAMRNHRTVERPRALLRRQAGVLALAFAVALAVFVVAGAAMSAGVAKYIEQQRLAR